MEKGHTRPFPCCLALEITPDQVLRHHIRQERILSKLQIHNPSNGGIATHFFLSSLPMSHHPKHNFLHSLITP